MSRKQAVVPTKVLAIGKGDDQEPQGNTNLKSAGGSESRSFNNELLNATLATLWCPPSLAEQTKNNRLTAAIHALMAFRPEDEIEGMIAAQAVAMHHGSMECFRRAMIPNQPVEIAARMRKDGASLSRGMVEMVAALDHKRGKGCKQFVRVEHVTVQNGGQAIVGNVSPVAPGGELADGT